MKRFKREKVKRFFWIILLILVVIGVYAFLVEPNLLSSTHIYLSEEGVYILTGDQKGIERDFRIVFFSDIHMVWYRDFHKKILQNIRELNPDLILFGGDAIAKITDVNGLEEFFSLLKEIAPVYSIFGNWEEYAPVHMRERYEKLDINLIEMNSTVTDVNGKSVGITGLESHYFFPQTSFEGIKPGNDLNILLIHSPGRLEEYPEIIGKFDIVLAGHTHGGQYYIPGLTDLFMKDAKNFRGAFEINGAFGYVTRGIGQWFPGRINSVPELVIIDFNKGERFYE